MASGVRECPDFRRTVEFNAPTFTREQVNQGINIPRSPEPAMLLISNSVGSIGCRFSSRRSGLNICQHRATSTALHSFTKSGRERIESTVGYCDSLKTEHRKLKTENPVHPLCNLIRPKRLDTCQPSHELPQSPANSGQKCTKPNPPVIKVLCLRSAYLLPF